MARPAKGSGPGAVERLAGAFWSMLAEMPYPDIKVVPLARRAGSSPNTLYYHFDGVADLARYALEAELDSDLAHRIVTGTLPEGALDGMEVRLARVVLFARSGSAELTGMLTAALRKLWLAEVGLSEEDLDGEERRDLVFLFGGVVAILGDEGLSPGPGSMESFTSRPLGRGAVQTMAALAARGRNPSM